MEPGWLGAYGLLLLWGTLASATVLVYRRRAAVGVALLRAARRFDPRRRAPRPAGRPIELVAGDVRRLGSRFRNPPPGLRFAKYEGLRRAYDQVLGEACCALGVDHLLGVLPPGDELDTERARVERLLEAAGLSTETTP